MSQPLHPRQGLPRAVDNQYLFSDHTLANLLPRDPRWRAALSAARDFHAWLRDLYRREREHLPNYNEAQLEAHWIRPILERLGHTFEPQATVPGLEAHITRPDYVLFPHRDARQAAAAAQNTTAYGQHALAVAEAKSWDRSLDKKEKGGGYSFEKQNPGYQIDTYVRALDLPWGLLTNGRRWRLVHRDTSHRLSIYYEIDLVALLEHEDPGRLRYFTLFFQQAALLPDAQGRRFLQDALEASRAYAVQLEEDMQDNVYRALELLMQGFVDFPRNGLAQDGNEGTLDPAQLRRVYDNSLYLLYRLLFILYAESRGLLPLDRETYREHYSLHDIKNDIAAGNAPTARHTAVFWARVRTLFEIIDGAHPTLNEQLGVPRYNGGLFNPRLHPFLQEKAVGDAYLIRAIDLLSRRQVGDDAAQKEFADYRTLGVRQLGSIYEGLLEYQPRLAQRDMVAVREGKDERWLPAAEAPSGATVIARREEGEVYLATDRGERKATGSYYTPEYIVQYIVENTLDPLLEEARARVEARAQEARGPQAQEAARRQLADEILALKCLDPAMGSGHFLVYATDYLALALATDPHVQPEATAEDDLVYWKRRVVERCIYGVDRNPLAVELAKLSLWLNTVAVDRPLSFLDHHLKCGDSLVGADVADLGSAPAAVHDRKRKAAPGQVDLFSYVFSQKLPAIMGRITEIVGPDSDSYETVQAKEAADYAVNQLKEPFEAVADLWVSAYFGNEYTAAEYEEARDLIGKPAALLDMPAVQGARQMAGERRFFHWQLAFPEVFYDEAGNYLEERAGFDAVVGNPPYVRMEGFKDLKEYLRNLYDVHETRTDIYAYFVERCLSLLRQNANLGYIISNKWLRSNYGRKLRSLLLKQLSIRALIDFGDLPVFQASTYPLILLLQVTAKNEDNLVTIAELESLDFTELSEAISQRQHKLSQSRLTSDEWTLAAVETKSLLDKLMLNNMTLEEFVGGPSQMGIKTGLNEAFIIDERTRTQLIGDKVIDEPRLVFPVCTGSEVRRYRIEWDKKYLIYTYHGVDLAGHPSIREYLEKYKTDLERRATEQVWYELQQPQEAYIEQLRMPKIVMPDLAHKGRFHLDREGTFITNKVYFLPSDSAYLLAVLNSKLINFCLQNTSAKFRGRYMGLYGQYLDKLPIAYTASTSSSKDRTRYLQKAQKLYQRYCDKDDLACVTGFVDHHLQQEQSDVVHDLLAFLAEQMIDMNKQKQQVTGEFWLDLEGVADADTFDTLRNRGKWESTLWKSDACRPFVDEDSRSTRSLDESLGWNVEAFKAFVKALAGSVANLSAIVNVYNTHHPRYRSLAARLQQTDDLIDQVVYRLYDLTEEEIAIVESQ